MCPTLSASTPCAKITCTNIGSQHVIKTSNKKYLPVDLQTLMYSSSEQSVFFGIGSRNICCRAEHILLEVNGELLAVLFRKTLDVLIQVAEVVPFKIPHPSQLFVWKTLEFSLLRLTTQKKPTTSHLAASESWGPYFLCQEPHCLLSQPRGEWQPL